MSHDENCHCKDDACDCEEHNGSNCDCGCECGCGCCGGGHFQRRYQTKEEQVADLESYLGELKLEVQAVEERLADLRK
jgi:hypothetical protein